MKKSTVRHLTSTGWTVLQEVDTGIPYLAKNFKEHAKGNENSWDEIRLMPQRLMSFVVNDLRVPVRSIYGQTRQFPGPQKSSVKNIPDFISGGVLDALKSMVVGR